MFIIRDSEYASSHSATARKASSDEPRQQPAQVDLLPVSFSSRKEPGSEEQGRTTQARVSADAGRLSGEAAIAGGIRRC